MIEADCAPGRATVVVSFSQRLVPLPAEARVVYFLLESPADTTIVSTLISGAGYSPLHLSGALRCRCKLLIQLCVSILA